MTKSSGDHAEGEPNDARQWELVPLGDTLDVVLGRFVGERYRLEAALFERWEELAGPDWAGCRPVRLATGGVLTVEVPGGGAASRLRYEADGLVGRITHSLGDDTVRSIRLRVAKNKA